MHFIFWLIWFLLTLYAYWVYIYRTLQHRITPHLFTFLPSTIVMSIVTVAQLNNYAGWSTWITWATTLACIIIVAISPWYGEKNITKFDAYSLVACLCTIVVWILTKDDLIAVALSCIVNALAFLPTWRKIYFKPHTESTLVYFISAFRSFLSVISIHQFSMVNWLFPAYLILNNLGLGIFRMIREKKIIKK